MIDVKQIAIDDMKSTPEKLERTLRAAGSIEFKCYHNDRDQQQMAVDILVWCAKEKITT